MSHSNTEHLLDLLEDAQATLALMLTSRHIGPLRDEAAAWAIKLKEISEVLEQVRLNRVEENKTLCSQHFWQWKASMVMIDEI